MVDTALSPLVRVTAPAKVNMYLHVVGRRPDGFHELDSLVMFATVGDVLTVVDAPRRRVPVLGLVGLFASDLSAEPPDSNLVIKAALGLAALLGRVPALDIVLTKMLPVASGIGGGSADAAACLRALCKLWRVSLSKEVLQALALKLGADVPVCLEGRAAYLGGIGGRLDPAPFLPECPALLVNPRVPVPTPAVFRARSGPFSRVARLKAPPRTVQAFAAELTARRNDLTAPAVALAPVIATVLAALDATAGCLLARLSGSGATCYALYPDDETAAAAAAALASGHHGWWIRPCRLLSCTDATL
ncbi:MAG: 4-(cytidine 5'-diphospho)-2-C-methyl-D-erythritol kinase [Rhodospirillaceae bacterium]